MNLALLLPGALAALTALLLPLLIHLARRSEQLPTDFAALRWLRRKPKPRHRLRFDEWPLLLLRWLLLALVALWLAMPVWQGSGSGSRWIVVLPGVDAASLRMQQHDGNAEVRWLAPGFPAIDTAAPGGVQPIASLLRELDAALPAGTRLSVLVPTQFDGADAQRPMLSRAVDWSVVAAGAPDATRPAARAMPALSVRYAPDRSEAVRYLRAAAATWSPPGVATPGFSAAPMQQPLEPEARALIWLAPGALPDSVQQWIANGGTALVDAQSEFERPAATSAYWRDATGAVLAEGAALGQGRLLRFTRPLRPATLPQLLEPDFPQQLRRLLVAPAPAPAPSRVAANDYAPITGAAAYPPSPHDLRPWLALVIALVLGLERWLATRRRRGIAP